MKNHKYFILGISFILALSSCKKDDDNSGTDDPFQAPYSALTVEDNKANLEDAGIQMINEIDILTQSDAIDIAVHFSDIAENLMGDNTSSAPMIAMELTASLQDGNTSQIISGLKSTAEEPNSISELWNELVGTFNWNAGTLEWDFTAGGDEIIINFPGMESDLTNTATYRVYNFTYVDIAAPAYDINTDSIEAQLPTSLTASLSYNGTELVVYSFNATYQPDGIPTLLSTSLAIEKFEFSFEITHELNTAVGATYAFKHDNNILIELHADVSGDWSEDNVNTEPEPEVEDVISESNAHIQVLNIKVAGSVNVANLGSGINALDDEYLDVTSSKEYNDKLADLMNQNASLVVVYADNNQKIAEVEAYSYLDEDSWETEYDVDVRFIFADESKVDSETYFDDGFSSLVDEINSLIADLNTEYNAQIEPIVY